MTPAQAARAAKKAAKRAAKRANRKRVVTYVVPQNGGGGGKRKRNRNRKRYGGGAGAQSVVSAVIPAARAMTSGGQRHETRVCTRRELVQQVVGTAAFSAVNYPINAGLGQMFAWLSSEARRFEKYRFRKLMFEYVNSVGPADATNAGGNVAFAVDLDVLDAVPASLQGMMQNENAMVFSPYDKIRLVVDPADLARRGWLYTRVGGVPSGADAKTYDLGSFILAQTGTSTNGLGNLFVEYEVELDVPQEAPSVSQKSTGTTSLTASALVGADAANSAGSVATWVASSASTFTCAVAGSYLFAHKFVGTVLATSGSAYGNTGTATVNSSANQYCIDSGALLGEGLVVVTAQVGQTFIPSIASATTVTSSVWRIAAYNSSVN